MVPRVCSRRVQKAEVADRLASLPAAVLHHPQLLHATLGQLVHAVLHRLHPVDRLLLLHHGLDGERSIKASRKHLIKLNVFLCTSKLMLWMLLAGQHVSHMETR